MWTASTKLLGRCAPFGCLAGFLKSCSTRLFPSTPHTLLLRPARLSPGTDAAQPRFSSMCISVHRRSKNRAAARFRTLSASPVTCSPSAVSNCASGSSPSYPSSRIRPRLPSSPMAPKKQSRAKSSADLLPDPDEGDCTDQMWKKIKAVIQKLSENGEYLLPDEDAAGVPGLASLPLGWTGADVPSSETRPGGNQRCSCTRCAKLRLTLNLSSWYHAKASAGSWDACRPLPRQCRAGRSHPFRAGRPAGQRLLVR